MQGSLYVWPQVELEFVTRCTKQLTESAESTPGQSNWLIIAAVVISVSSLLCCGCMAVAWVLGDLILEQFSLAILNLPI